MDFQSQGQDYLSKMRPMLNKQALYHIKAMLFSFVIRCYIILKYFAFWDVVTNFLHPE